MSTGKSPIDGMEGGRDWSVVLRCGQEELIPNWQNPFHLSVQVETRMEWV